MLKGDLTTSPLAPLLLSLATDSATGCLHVVDTEGDEALVFFKSGDIYAVSVPGRRPQLGAKLISSGALSPEALAEALEAQRSELQGWRLGELLVHLGYVDRAVVEAFVKEQVYDALWDLLRWTGGTWRFRRNERTREDVAPPMAVADLLAGLRDRGMDWQQISAVVHGPAAVPVLSARDGARDEAVLDSDAWSMLCKIDGRRTLAELARDGGYTLFEAGQVLVRLVQAGLVDIEEDLPTGGDIADPATYGAAALSAALTREGPDVEPVTAQAGEAREEPEDAADALSRLARLVDEVSGNLDSPVDTDAALANELIDPVTEPPQVVGGSNAEPFADSIARVSAALNDVLGAPPDRQPEPPPPVARIQQSVDGEPVEDETERARAERIRAAAAAELAAAQDEVNERRTDGKLRRIRATLSSLASGPREAEIVDLGARRRHAGEAERRESERLEAERLEAERREAERLEAERREAERREAERREAERLEQERREAERLEAERLEAERREAERQEAERLEAERQEAERREAERQEAERREAERREAERLEAERLEAERREAERLEQERREAERLEAERREAERREAERQEAERREAERLEQERREAERLEAERLEAAMAAEVSQDATAASLLLSEFSQEASEPEVEPLSAEPENPDTPEPVPVGAPPTEITDTAALLRELSSLGADDPPPAPTLPPTPVHRPSTQPSEKKKRRGLFGR